jgi:hypothetical protein
VVIRVSQDIGGKLLFSRYFFDNNSGMKVPRKVINRGVKIALKLN